MESYLVDYRATQTTYHLKNDEKLILSKSASEQQIAHNFAATVIKGAIVGAQQGQILYPDLIS
ncbi:MAG: hypothetical protein K2W88_09875 [Pararheinheimera sp.]|nr:hypothetical protein [Rheinheimera sp.]